MKIKKLISILAASFFFLSLSIIVSAKDFTYLVGAGSDAGKQAATAQSATWVKNLTKAINKAANDINAGGDVSVLIKVAAGDYNGDMGSGAYAIPLLNNLNGTLKIEGGYDSSFASRNPFATPSKIVTVKDRSAPIITFTTKSKLKALIVDGLIFDSEASNAYDKKSNTLLYGKSCSHVFVKYNYLELNLLEYKNVVFMNAANRVMETLVRAATPEAEVHFYNTVFLNNRIPLKLDGPGYKNKINKIIVDHCSFILNWAYNPDPNTGLPAALEIGTNNALNEIVLTNNLFYSNFGGAIIALNAKSPGMTINKNNFIGNGLLHGESEPSAVAMIISAGGKKQPINVATIEDVNFVNEAEGNVSISPGISYSLGNVKTVDANKIKANENWQNVIKSILGLNLDGGKVSVKDYAPKQNYDPKYPPFATVTPALAYGASEKLAK
ncbi:MAG: hypothetical protein ABIA04_05340 [Pseudomonadota bacterium]